MPTATKKPKKTDTVRRCEDQGRALAAFHHSPQSAKAEPDICAVDVIVAMLHWAKSRHCDTGQILYFATKHFDDEQAGIE